MGLDPKDQAWEDHLTKIGVLPSYRPTYPGREEFDAGWDAAKEIVLAGFKGYEDYDPAAVQVMNDIEEALA